MDSLPTSANQEDHVSMATFAAWRLRTMYHNTSAVLAIEWLAAALLRAGALDGFVLPPLLD